MSQTVIITSAGFNLLAVSQGGDASTLLLSYTMAPDASNPLTSTDALNPANYTITGPTTNNVLSVAAFSSTGFTLVLDAPLGSGSYTITVANVQSSGAPLGIPSSLTFMASTPIALEPINQGADNDLSDNPLRRFLPPQYRYKPAWEALIAALNDADIYVRANAYSAFDQLFISSADRPYLFQRAADYGVQYPAQVGMSDRLFRSLTIKSTAKKLVHQALLEILEVFYGEDAVRANVTTGLNQPYAIRNGDSITFLFDDREEVTATFNAADFSNIAVATAGEVSAVLTRAFEAANIPAYASVRAVDAGYAVRVYSGALGLLGSIQVTAGMAQNALQFPNRIPLFTVLPSPAPQWNVERKSQEECRFTWTRTYTPGNLMDVQIGDYVLLDFTTASTIRGSYQVTDVRYDVDPATGNPANLSWFSILPSATFPLRVGDPVATITQATINELVFYGVVRQTAAQGINPSYIAQYGQTGVDVIFPATTQAVERGPTDAAYPHLAATVGGGISTGSIPIVEYSVSGAVPLTGMGIGIASVPQTTVSGAVGAYSFSNIPVGTHTVTPVPITITVTPTIALAPGQVGYVTATAHYANGVTGDVTGDCTWASSNPAVMTASGSMITAVDLGTSTITATFPGGTSLASRSVTVVDANVTGVNFTAANVTATCAGSVLGLDLVEIGFKVIDPVFTVETGLLTIDPATHPLLGDRLLEQNHGAASTALNVTHILGTDNVTVYPASVNPADHTQIFVTGVTLAAEIIANAFGHDYFRAIVPVTAADASATTGNINLGSQHGIMTGNNMVGDTVVVHSTAGLLNPTGGTIAAVQWNNTAIEVDPFDVVTRDATNSTAYRAIFAVTKTYGLYTAKLRYDPLNANPQMYGSKVFYGWDMG